MADEPVIDDSIVEGLRRLGPEVHGEIVRLWFDNLDPTLDALRRELAAGERPALVAGAHTLRGSAANVGAARLAAACAALESGAQGGADDVTLSALLADVLTDADAARTALAAFADGPRP